MAVNEKDFAVPGANGAMVIDWTAYKDARIAEVDIDKVEYRTLPATGLVVPARISLGKVKSRKSLNGGVEVQAEVLIDGRLVGHAVDEGHGGGVWLRPVIGGEVDAVEQVQDEYHARQRSLDPTLSPEELWLSPEELYNDLLEEAETVKTLKRKMRAKAPVLRGLDSRRAKVDDDGLSYTVTQWLESRISTESLLADPGPAKRAGITHAWNGTEWQAL